MDENNFYIRIDYRAKGENSVSSENNHGAHIMNKNMNSQRYLIGGGIYNRKGGTIIFKVKDLKEAMEIKESNLLARNVGRKYEEVKRDLVILPKTI